MLQLFATVFFASNPFFRHIFAALKLKKRYNYATRKNQTIRFAAWALATHSHNMVRC